MVARKEPPFKMYNVKQIHDTLNAITPQIHKLARQLNSTPVDPEDIAQTVLIKLLTNTKSMPVNISYSWLRTVVRNTITDTHRSHRSDYKYRDHNASLDLNGNVSEAEDEYSFSTPASLQTQENDIEPDLLPRIKKVLSNLSKSHRQALVLHMEGYSLREIAELTRANEGTVRSRIHYARKHAQRQLVAFR